MITISDSLLQTLKSSFEQERNRLCRDAAKLLRVPEAQVKQLVQQAMPTYKLTVIEEDEKRQTCPVLLQRALVLERCRDPCLMGTGRCLTHQTAHSPPDLPTTIQGLTRVERMDPSDPPMWCDEETHQVYNSEGVVIGSLENGVLELYTFEPEES